MHKYLLAVIGSMLVSGCSFIESTVTEKAAEKEKLSQAVKVGIIDACYTVLEYSPADKNDRIQKYLETKQAKGDLTKNEKFVLESCIKRTEQSKNWGKK